MPAQGHVLVWGTPAGEGRASDTKGWYQQLKAWWIADKAVRRQARMTALHARWDARHETVRPMHAAAATEVATMLYGLRQ